MKPTRVPPPEDPVRPHEFDGIQEYDKRLPNWWLYTLYATIAFSVVYWMWYENFRQGADGPQRIESAMAEIETRRLSATAGAQLDDATLWQMSRNDAFVAAGKTIFNSNCAACHLASLRGKSESPAAIGPDLTDAAWLHGSRPLEIHGVVAHGVLAKGMPAWNPVLGARKVSEVVAYILSHHRNEPPVANAAATAGP